MAAKNFKDKKVYKKAIDLSMDIFQISKSFSGEEKYSLTDQIRRSSRSVCANMADAYRKRLYPAHFVSKVSDCDAENSETGVWLDFALACEYISAELHTQLISKNAEGGRMLHPMIINPEKY